MNKREKRLYEFGPFRLDPEERLLTRDRETVSLTPKAFETLVVLVENQGHVFGKEELIAKVWPDSFVEENNLAQNISALRKVLGEGTSGQRYIETVPRLGYRFVANVRKTSGEEVDFLRHESTTTNLLVEAEPKDEVGHVGENNSHEVNGFALAQRAEIGNQGSALRSEAPYSQPRAEDAQIPSSLPLLTTSDQRRKFWVVAGVLGVIAATALIYFAFVRKSTTPAAAAPRRLAVLPFRNLKQDPETDFLAFSLADAVITKLGYVRELIVRPSAYVDRYRNQTIEPAKVAAELNVNTLLTASYVKEGDDLRITAQLIDVTTNEILSRNEMNLKYDKLLTVQDRVAREIIQGLHLNLSAAEAEKLQLDVPQNPQAYEYYLYGVDLYSANKFSMAAEMLEKSIALESNFGLAWAHLGRAYNANAAFDLGGQASYDKAFAAYEKAVSLNPQQIEPRIFMANTFTDTGRVEQSIPLLRQILESNPNQPEAHWELGYAYRFSGMLKESIEECERARQLDPEVKIHSSALNSYLYDGQYEKFLQSLPQAQDNAYIIFYRGFGRYHLKDWAGASADFNRAYELNPSLYTEGGKALSYAIGGQNQQGLKLLRALERKMEERGVRDAEAIYKIAQAYAVLGDKAGALRLLQRSIEGGFFCYPYFINDPLLDSIRSEPAYATIMEQARQRHEAIKRRFF